jgi:SOS response regulatory protein OraA/RecX
MTVPVVTALRARGSGRVAIDLDGREWRIVPLEAAYAAGLVVGRGLDRGSARTLRRELRRLEAVSAAMRALRDRDHTEASLEQRLAARGVVPALRRETVGAVSRAGLVDDERFAAGRAELLARRGAGDELIADDLERQGVPAAAAEVAIAALEPEQDRIAAIIEARGRNARTARYLAARGFSEAALEPLVAELTADA